MEALETIHLIKWPTLIYQMQVKLPSISLKLHLVGKLFKMQDREPFQAVEWWAAKVLKTEACPKSNSTVQFNIQIQTETPWSKLIRYQ